jgi:hypothetical protein
MEVILEGISCWHHVVYDLKGCSLYEKPVSSAFHPEMLWRDKTPSTSSVKSKEKGKVKVKVKEDSDGRRQRAWMQTDDGLVNTKREET